MPDAGEPAPPLRVEALSVTYRGGLRAVRGVSLRVSAGQRVGLVGESGCGKTSIVRACLGLLPTGAHVGGSISVGGTEVVGAASSVTRRLLGLVVGYVPQSPGAAFDPVHRVRHHVEEAWRAQGERPPPNAVERLLTGLGLPAGRSRQYPHQWSGGMLQRATVAAATAHRPLLTIADEPTSALDAELADSVMEAVGSATSALLLVTHDLRLAARSVESIAVCYAGRLVEVGSAAQVLSQPRHPYTRALVAALPTPGRGLPIALPGNPPPASAPDQGCAFEPRCPLAVTACRREAPALSDGVACLRV